MKAFASALSFALLALGSVEGLAAQAQDQAPPKPTFKSAVDLVPVDVSVIARSVGFGPVWSPPCTARMEQLSTTARDQSI
jgi:hypothetical protein